jgi:hypothetical protein
MSEDEDRLRKRIREREDDLDARINETKAKAAGFVSSRSGALSEKVEDLLLRVDPLVDQLNNLYNMYFSGAEQTPPHERRKNIDQIMVTLQMLNKPTAGLLYRYTAAQSKYLSYRDHWDKMMKDLESGKKARRAPSRKK